MALFVVSTRDPGFAVHAEAQARAQFVRMGFRDVAGIDLPGWRALHARPILGGAETRLVRGDEVAAVAGTPMVDGLVGTGALERLLDPALLPNPDWDRVEGNFTALVRRAGRSFLAGDHFGLHQLFHDRERRFFSTSLLAAVEVLPRVRFDPQGLYEWAFGVTVLGEDTIFAELRQPRSDELIELTLDGAVSLALPKPVSDWRSDDVPLTERVARSRDLVTGVAETLTRGFGDAITCPLSAGFDSRLMLAALRAVGARPSVYVYGPPGGADVAIAREIGVAEGFDVEWIDKQAAPIAPDAFPEQVERNFHDLDGLPNFGNIFDNGDNARARDKRHAGGALGLSGGGGEIFRDFFFLRDRPVSPWTLTRCFNSRFLPGDAAGAFDADTYRRRIAEKVAAAVGSDDPARPLPRGHLDQAFTRNRVPALFRWEVNAETRHGPYLMFFQQPRLVVDAWRVPVELRTAGAFQAMLIDAIDPALARHRSGYGFPFDRRPGWRAWAEENATRYRPVWLRERTYALKRRRGPMTDEHGGVLDAGHMGRVIDLGFPVMRRFFDVDGVTDAGLWRRLACLEYMAGKLGGKLAA